MLRRSDFPKVIEEHDLARLTGQQLSCLLRLRAGRSVGVIARQLGIHKRTVREHLAVARAKLQHEFIPRLKALSLDHALENGMDEGFIRAKV